MKAITVIPDHIGHDYSHHNYIGHNYSRHAYIGRNGSDHNYIGHDYIGHNQVAAKKDPKAIANMHINFAEFAREGSVDRAFALRTDKVWAITI